MNSEHPHYEMFFIPSDLSSFSFSELESTFSTPTQHSSNFAHHTVDLGAVDGLRLNSRRIRQTHRNNFYATNSVKKHRCPLLGHILSIVYFIRTDRFTVSYSCFRQPLICLYPLINSEWMGGFLWNFDANFWGARALTPLNVVFWHLVW